jgi:5-(carboxyamino)imidazole ribonucleotide mutase
VGPDYPDIPDCSSWHWSRKPPEVVSKILPAQPRGILNDEERSGYIRVIRAHRLISGIVAILSVVSARVSGLSDHADLDRTSMMNPKTRPKAAASSRVKTPNGTSPWVGVIMGSKSDLKYLQPAIDLLTELQIPHEARVVSAHRTPDWMFEYASTAESRGLEVIIAAAGGAAHLPGMVAAKTVLPVLGVPVPATLLNGLDALLSIVQMPKGVPVGTLAIGEPGAANAALLAASIVSGSRPELRERLRQWRAQRTSEVLAATDLGPTHR